MVAGRDELKGVLMTEIVLSTLLAPSRLEPESAVLIRSASRMAMRRPDRA
jgi:hypothetical protein